MYILVYLYKGISKAISFLQVLKKRFYKYCPPVAGSVYFHYRLFVYSLTLHMDDTTDSLCHSRIQSLYAHIHTHAI